MECFIVSLFLIFLVVFIVELLGLKCYIDVRIDCLLKVFNCVILYNFEFVIDVFLYVLMYF